MNSFPAANTGKWSSGLCGCFDDCGSCCLGCWCPCVAVGRYVEIIDQGATSCLLGGTAWCCLQSCTGCGWIYSCGYRTRLRQKFGLPESPCGDCCTEFWCSCLSTCQVYRELQNRGINPAVGYDGVKHVYDNPAISTMAPAGKQAMYK